MGVYSVITATGSYIPSIVKTNQDFLKHEFYGSDGKKLEKTSAELIESFEKTGVGINERRYAKQEVTSDLGFLAIKNLLETSAFIDKETFNFIIFAHNFGDTKFGHSDFVPTLASRVKKRLEIKNPETEASDLSFGCPGWLQGLIHAHRFFKSGDGKKALVIGAEKLSAVSDGNDVDSMIYADGGGAAILEFKSSEKPIGILSCSVRSYAEDSDLLRMGAAYGLNGKQSSRLFLKMDGNKLFKQVLKKVPLVIKESLDKAGLDLSDVKKFLLHQANERMDRAIVERVYKLYGFKNPTEEMIKNIMPMVISWLGNSSVATLPMLFDLLMKGKLENHRLNSGDIVVFVSVGAGLNINSMVYKIP